MLVSSRSFDEYVAFFDLSAADLERSVLDCSAGASSFVAELNARGGKATAVDPAYANPAALHEAVVAGMREGTQIIDANEDRFVWTWYGSPERRTALRREASARFLADVERAPERYVAGALPSLPFATGSFDLALCSHLLFTWADTFDEAWHVDAITELLRIAREVRVFPTVLQGAGEHVEFLPRLIEEFRNRGFSADLVDVPYEFQRGAHAMLVITYR